MRQFCLFLSLAKSGKESSGRENARFIMSAKRNIYGRYIIDY